MEFASTQGIDSLFHYCRYRADRFEDVICNNRIFLSDTSNFNDPWDCRPCFDTTQLDDPEFRERQVAWLDRAARHRTPHILDAIHRARADQLRTDRALLEAVISQMSDISAEIKKRYRVFCLTTKPINTLMWSHYAENHTGLCIEFACRNEVFSGAFKVTYAAAYPILDLADGADERVLKPLLTKSHDWSYEEEYRLIAQERAFALSSSLITDSNFLAIPPESVLSVTIGCNTPNSVQDEIASVLHRHSSSARLRKLKRIANRYELAFAA